MFALVDCNNFYASCERLFRPDLQAKPIVVLSNNDGCVIARSNEAKALGIKMGEPFFRVKGLCNQHDVHIFSSNYTLYGDLSQRVMSIIEEGWPEVEIYSIDEAFLDLSSLPESEHTRFCTELRQKILKSVGIPTSIGIGETKTLAKIANYICKKKLRVPVFNVVGQRHWLKQIEINEVWGVGRQWTKKLMQRGIMTAADLARSDHFLLKKQFNVVLQRTAMELKGVSCLAMEDWEPKKSIMSSKSFGEMQTDFDAISQAISSHCSRAYEKLRQQNLVAEYLYVFVRTNRFRKDLAQYHNSMVVKFVNPTDDLRLITKMAKRCLRQLFQPGFQYKKVGICLEQLANKNYLQMDLFNQPDDESLLQKERLLQVFDKINRRYGRHSIKLGAEGYSKPWAMRAELKSPAYTTRWTELPYVR